MGTRVLLALGIALALHSVAAADEPAPAEPREPRAPQAADAPELRRGFSLPRFRWGIPDSGLSELEAERHMFGFYLHFSFGGAGKPRSGQALR